MKIWMFLGIFSLLSYSENLVAHGIDCSNTPLTPLEKKGGYQMVDKRVEDSSYDFEYQKEKSLAPYYNIKENESRLSEEDAPDSLEPKERVYYEDYYKQRRLQIDQKKTRVDEARIIINNPEEEEFDTFEEFIERPVERQDYRFRQGKYED